MKATLFDSRLERLREATVVAILRMASAADAIEGMGVAVRGGFEAVEVTMNTPGAADALSEVAGRIDAIVGAGTVLEPEQVKEAYDAGAEFIVTPVVVPEVVEDTPILVSGGITPENYLGYLDAGVELVAFGESVFSSQLAAEGRYDEIERRAVAVCRRLDMYITDHAEG